MPPELASTLLYEMRATLGTPLLLGATPEGTRAVFDVTGGTFEGPRLKGRVLPSGADWGRFRPDGSFAIDVRIVLETHDGALIYVTYQGRIVATPEVQAVLFAEAPAELPAPDRYYFRVVPLFETAAPAYAWLNGIVAVGIGEIVPDGVAYRVHEIL